MAEDIKDFNSYVIKTLNDSFPNLKERQTIFQIREKKIDKLQTKNLLVEQNNTSYSFLIFTLLFLILGLLFKQKLSGFSLMLKSCFNAKTFDSLLKNGRFINKSLSITVFPLYVCVIALMCQKAIYVFNIELHISNFFILLAGIIVVLIFSFTKLVLMKIFGILFSNKNIVSFYISNQISFFALDFTVLLLPLFCSFFLKTNIAEVAFYISCGLFTFLSLIRVIRGFKILIKKSNSFHLYLFLYLCSVEIVPLLIAIKVLSTQI
ncbi:MAG: DUF4271 domain-containing protein [Bacteroidales bacterium]|jgi:hypothetical protein|nr:DUF4271 domain-containing protein [Bacteroidales bacterium]